MKLKYLPAAVITAPAELLVPGEAPGSYEICKFKAKFRRLDVAQSKALSARLAALHGSVLSGSELTSLKEAVLEEHLLGWDGLPGKDDDGRDVEIPFSASIRADLVKERCYLEGLYDLFLESQRAPQKADAKNSATSA